MDAVPIQGTRGTDPGGNPGAPKRLMPRFRLAAGPAAAPPGAGLALRLRARAVHVGRAVCRARFRAGLPVG